MALTQLGTPYPVFTDTDGTPLDAGFLYFGEQNENPETSPITVYYDAALTQAAAQPLRTSNGYVMRNGSPAILYASTLFSVTVRNSQSELVVYAPVSFSTSTTNLFQGSIALRDVATLLADTFLSYSVNIAAGDIVRTSEEGFAYEVAASGASDQHLTTAGGVKLYVQAGTSGYDVRAFGAVGDGATNDYAIIASADATAALDNAQLVFSTGTFAINTSHSFAAQVSMTGGVLTGSGTLTLSSGFSAAPYYCFDCLVGEVDAEVIYAEWFGARQSTATPTSTSDDISSKAWNTWPSFINSGNFLTGQNYGDGTFLAANVPFSNSDTWDFIAIQRALWSIGIVTSGVGRGEVRLLAREYYLTKAVRFVGDMAATMRGAGRTKTILRYAAYLTHEQITYSAGNAKSLISLYKTGPDPIYIADLAAVGPDAYSFGTDTLYVVGLINSNGVTLDNCWISVGDACVYMDDSTSDFWLRGCMFEFGTIQIYGFDALSWCQVADSGMWQSGVSGSVGIQVAGYAFVTGCTFVSFTTSFILGTGSHLSGCTVIEDGTGYRTTIDGRVISRRLRFAAGTTRTVLTVAMGDNTAVRTKMVAGGTVIGLGAAGIERTLTWYREASNPIAGGAAATKWGTAGAIAVITEAIATSATSFSLRITNAGGAGQEFDADVTVFIEGSDFVIEGV